MKNKLGKLKGSGILGKELKEILSKNVGGQELQERVSEYIKVKKLEEKIAREILELWASQSKTESYIDGLSALLANLKKELEA